MAIAFACACGKSLHAKDELAGKKTRCPGCGSILTIPALSGRRRMTTTLRPIFSNRRASPRSQASFRAHHPRGHHRARRSIGPLRLLESRRMNQAQSRDRSDRRDKTGGRVDPRILVLAPAFRAHSSGLLASECKRARLHRASHGDAGEGGSRAGRADRGRAGKGRGAHQGRVVRRSCPRESSSAHTCPRPP